MLNDKWRLIPHLKADGKTQMAIDKWLLEQHRQRKHPPTLRFYTWSPAAISLGYHQKQYPQFWDNLTWNNQKIDIVKRPTGGKAVLHQGDLTYAVITSMMPGKRLEVYQNICQFLIDGWRTLGIELKYGKATKEYAKEVNCFATATVADIVTLDGKKAIGSAQLRRGKTILQHGSIILNSDPELFVKIFNESPPENLASLIPRSQQPEIPLITETLTKSALDCFKINLEEQPLSATEWQDILTNCSNPKY